MMEESIVDQFNLVFIPGGPWISGKYWDQYLKNSFLRISSQRYCLLNHEEDYSPNRDISKQDLESDFKKYLDNVIDTKKKNVIVAHSFGAWLTISSLPPDFLKNIHKLILVCMPLSNDRSDKFKEKFELLKTPFNDNNSFSAFFKNIAPLYFFKFNDKDFDSLFTESYMAGNKQIIYSTEEVENLVSKFLNIPNAILIFGENDLITGQPWKEQPLKDFFIINDSGHFPMLENSELFTRTLLNAIL